MAVSLIYNDVAKKIDACSNIWDTQAHAFTREHTGMTFKL